MNLILAFTIFLISISSVFSQTDKLAAAFSKSYDYEKNKDYTSAYKYFEKVVNLYPFGYDALLMYAWTNFQTGKTREAKILFNKVLMLSPGDTSALEGLGLIK